MSDLLNPLNPPRIERVTDADLGKRGPKQRRCALCDWTQRQARYMVQGPTGAYLCDRCALHAAEIIRKAMARGK